MSKCGENCILSEQVVASEVYMKAAKTPAQLAFLQDLETYKTDLYEMEVSARYLTENLDKEDTQEFLNFLDANNTCSGSSITGDAVSGFSIAQAENALLPSFSFDEYVDNITDMYPSNPPSPSYTSTAMEDFFNYWD